MGGNAIGALNFRIIGDARQHTAWLSEMKQVLREIFDGTAAQTVTVTFILTGAHSQPLATEQARSNTIA